MAAYIKPEELHKIYVDQIRAVGESLIKNAESIAGNERYISSLYISVDFDPQINVPEISINRCYLPERIAEVE